MHGGEALKRKARYDLIGVAWVVAAAVVILIPALRPGMSFGPFDLLSRFGLTANPHVHVRNAFLADQIEQFAPWSYYAWHQVHQGHLPLWNPYNVLGTPFAFNWQSGVFSLPALVSYLFPVHLAYTVIVLAKLLIAGTGAYTLCRVMGLGSLASAFGGTVFELSGPIVVHAGWSMVGVTAWTGWILTATLLLLKGRHPLRYMALLAFSVAFAIYGGHPESLVLVALTTLIFAAVHLIVSALSSDDPLLRPSVFVLGGAVCGAALGAPLLLPATQVVEGSARRYGAGAVAFPLSHVPNLLASGFQGLDFRTAAYVGVITVALAVAGVRIRWGRPDVCAMVAVTAVMALLTFFSPLDDLLRFLPGGRTVTWSRAVMVLALALAVLAAIGLDALARLGDASESAPSTRTVTNWMAGALVVSGLVLAAAALGAETGVWKIASNHESKLISPAIEVAIGLVVVGVIRRPSTVNSRLPRVGRSLGLYGVCVLLVAETAVLIVPGLSFWSVSSGYFPQTPAVTALKQDVGDALVGFGSCTRRLASQAPSADELGVRPDANIAYGIRELAVYDPVLPQSYYRSLEVISGQQIPESLSKFGVFCAEITSVSVARVYGVGYILEPRGQAGPTGTTFVSALGGETLYRVPGSAQATLSNAPASGAKLSVFAPGEAVPVQHPDDATWRVRVDPASSQLLRFRLSAEPGWRATIDGHPLTLRKWADGVMLEARVPPGPHVVVLKYWPSSFTSGIVLASCAVAGFAVAFAAAGVLAIRRRRPERHIP